jgi:hypothetical protein
MPSPVAHSLAAYSLIVAIRPQWVASRHTHQLAVALAILLGPMADWDFLVAHFTRNPVLQHHFFSHSIPFVIGLTVLFYLLIGLRRRNSDVVTKGKTALLLGASYGTHLLLDYFTDDGSAPLGIPLLWPLTESHFRAPIVVFFSIHRGSLEALFSWRNVEAVAREIAICLPVALLLLLRANRKNEKSKIKNQRNNTKKKELLRIL